MAKSRIKLPISGFIPDQPDKRDHRKTGVMMSAMSSVVPDTNINFIDWTDPNIPVKNQGRTDMCVGFSTATAIELANSRHRKIYLDLSERMSYQYARKLDKIPGEDHAGSTVRGGLKAANKIGVCEENYWKFSEADKYKPVDGYLVNASKYRIGDYSNIARDKIMIGTNDYGINIKDVARALQTNPVIGGFYISEDFSYISENGSVLPEMIRGDYGHAMCIVGYNPSGKMFKIKNSWGYKWADKGYCYMSEQIMRDCLVSAWSFSLDKKKNGCFLFKIFKK